jgi:fatty-acyl-CoA synthase
MFAYRTAIDITRFLGSRYHTPTSLGTSRMAIQRHSYVQGASGVPLFGDTIGVHFDSVAERWHERMALIVRHQSIRWSYGQLKARVDAFAAGLLALGIEPGDRVGIWSPNNAEWVITQFATAKAGAILVNITPPIVSPSLTMPSTKWAARRS